MKRLYIKLLILLAFLTLSIAQTTNCAYCAEGIDIAKFKNVKNVFKKDKNKPAKQKSLKLEEVPTDDRGIVAPEDIGVPDSGFFSDDVTVAQPELKPKKEKAKKERRFFKRKNKKQTEEQNVIQEEAIQEEVSAEDKNKVYVQDDDLVYIKNIEIYGNNLIDVNYIKEQLSSKEGNYYNRAEVSNDLKNLYSTGYFTRNIRALPIKIDDNNITLRIVVEENPPITSFAIVGNNSVSTAEIMNILSQYEGKPQNIVGLNTAIEQIQELYSSKGYILARVKKISDDPDGCVNVLIDEGIIGDIIVDGNNKTKDFIVKRNIFLQPGSVYNENTMRADILRLMGTQAFKDVQREIQQDETTGLYNVYVALEEQRTGKISLGVGIDSVSGFFGSVGFSENNFRGLGQKINLNVMAGTGILMNDSSVMNKANLQGEISFLEPMFKRENQSLAIRGFGRYYGSYQVPLAIEKRFGGEITIARKFSTFKNLSGSISFGVEDVIMEEGDESKIRAKYYERHMDFADRKKELSDGIFVKITPALIYDTRDSAINARRGVLARFSLEEYLAISGNTFGKLTGMIRKFIPVGKKSSIVLTARAGGKLHGKMPEFAGYSLGGPYTIRGFNISEVGVGDGYMMGSAEYRVPIPFIDRVTSNSFLNNLRLAAFVDAGTLFQKSIGTHLYDKPGYAISMGFGLRIFIPGLGPINLDYGIPLTNTRSVHRSGGFFTFGMGEMY